jgi:putative PIN family toxin of toxin-antitoxin system
MNIKAVIDTNVIFSGLQSQKGSSHRLLRLLPEKRFESVISVPLLLEYESVLSKHSKQLKLTQSEIQDFLDYICSIATHTKIYYLWRPRLIDPFDDHILELAIASSSKYIITFNISDFKGSEDLGVKVITPDEFIVKVLGE